MITREERIDQYIGPLIDSGAKFEDIPAGGDTEFGHYSTTVEETLSLLPGDEVTDFSDHPWFSSLHNQSLYHHQAIVNIYIKHLRKLLAINNVTQGRYCIVVGDMYSCNRFPVLTPYSNKSQRVFNNKLQKETSGTCLKFLYDRWWSPLYEFLEHPIEPFADKEDRCVWRGASSGRMDGVGNRFALVKKWHNRTPDIDVAFVKVRVAPKREEYVADIQNGFVATVITPREWAKSKYIISCPGNMNESGLHWKLASNSVILMAPPEACTWLLEDRLIPGIHYVRVKDDWSDLESQLEWCRSHQSTCQEIAENARKFVNQFVDQSSEEALGAEVFRRYLMHVNK
jgi:hypothetical protein